MRWLAFMLLLLLPCYAGGYRWAVCIDPGHGCRSNDPGTNCGAGGGDFVEAELAWEIGYEVYQYLQQELGESCVSITREECSCPEPWDRAEIGQGLARDPVSNIRVLGGDSTVVDAFISIHFDTYEATLNGSSVIVYTEGGYDKDHPCLNPPLDSCYAQAKDLISCFVLVVDSETEWDAAAKENGQRWELPGDGMYQRPNDGIVGRSDLRVLSDAGWRGTWKGDPRKVIPPYKAQCLIECEFLTRSFCSFLSSGGNKDDYIEAAAEGIINAVRLYRQRADPGGRLRIVDRLQRLIVSDD